MGILSIYWPISLKPLDPWIIYDVPRLLSVSVLPISRCLTTRSRGPQHLVEAGPQQFHSHFKFIHNQQVATKNLCTVGPPCQSTSLASPGRGVNHHALRRCKTSQTNSWRKYSPSARNPTWHPPPRPVGDFPVSRRAFSTATPRPRPRRRYLTFSLPCVVTNTSHRLFTRVNFARRSVFPQRSHLWMKILSANAFEKLEHFAPSLIEMHFATHSPWSRLF